MTIYLLIRSCKRLWYDVLITSFPEKNQCVIQLSRKEKGISESISKLEKDFHF